MRAVKLTVNRARFPAHISLEDGELFLALVVERVALVTPVASEVEEGGWGG